jgi:hypothetical protein
MAKKRKLKRGECKDIESITIQFENCEIIELSREDIANVYFHNIRKNITICINAVIEDYEAEDVWLVVREEAALRKHKVFGFGEEQSLIDRVGAGENQRPVRDITHFFIKYNTGEEETVSCVWEGESNYDNPAQVCEIVSDSDEEGVIACYPNDKYLTISISKDNIGKED